MSLATEAADYQERNVHHEYHKLVELSRELGNDGSHDIVSFFRKQFSDADKRRRRYLPTLGDLIDRLSIAQLKAIFIHQRRAEYVKEMDLIMRDVDSILDEMDRKGRRLRSAEVRAILVVMLANRFIWENEAATRQGNDTAPPEDQLRRLTATHSINGVRNTAKNELSGFTGERVDYKVDCFAASLVEEFGNWNGLFEAPAEG